MRVSSTWAVLKQILRSFKKYVNLLIPSTVVSVTPYYGVKETLLIVTVDVNSIHK